MSKVVKKSKEKLKLKPPKKGKKGKGKGAAGKKGASGKGKKKVVSSSGLGYIKKIYNPKTKRYVKLESQLGKSIEKRLNRLLKKKTRTADEQRYVDDILFSKFCKCTKSVIISESKKKCPDRKLPYAVCTNNVYIRRGLKIKSNASRECRKTFKWYK